MTVILTINIRACIFYLGALILAGGFTFMIMKFFDWIKEDPKRCR